MWSKTVWSDRKKDEIQLGKPALNNFKAYV